MTILPISALIDFLRGGLIISVQEDAESPLNDPGVIAALVETISIPGCVGVRLNGTQNISVARQRTKLPIFGIEKVYLQNGRVLITPRFQQAEELADAGADVITIDATEYPRQTGQSIAELISHIHTKLNKPVMADISTLEEGIAAAKAGADLVATTLSGYISAPKSNPFDPPDLGLIRDLVNAVDVPVIAEGRYNTPELAHKAIVAGAHAVVVGSAITRPEFIANQFISHLKEK